MVEPQFKSPGQGGSHKVPAFFSLYQANDDVDYLPSYCNEKASRDHGPGDEEEDEEVDVHADGEDEHHGEQGERDDDLPHHGRCFWPLPPFQMFASFNILRYFADLIFASFKIMQT